MLIATYDYWGYYNVCFLGDEVKDPTRKHSASAAALDFAVACLYIVMNISILGVVPWREMLQSGTENNKLYVISIFMQRIYGSWAANLATGLVMWTAFASVFSLMLGYSRVPYAAALDGNYFPCLLPSSSGISLPECFSAGVRRRSHALLLSIAGRRHRCAAW